MSHPNASEELIQGIMNFMEKKRMEDPLSLLQDDLYLHGGQLTFNSMAPNYEIALFLAKITGGILLTDSATRWEEFVDGKYHKGSISPTNWQALISSIKEIAFPFFFNPDAVLLLWQEGKFGKMRKAWQNLYTYVHKDLSIKIDTATELLIKELSNASATTETEISSLINSNTDIDKYRFDVTFIPIIPSGGITNKNILRFLLTSGMQEYAKNVPMALFMAIKR